MSLINVCLRETPEDVRPLASTHMRAQNCRHVNVHALPHSNSSRSAAVKADTLAHGKIPTGKRGKQRNEREELEQVEETNGSSALGQQTPSISSIEAPANGYNQERRHKKATRQQCGGKRPGGFMAGPWGSSVLGNCFCLVEFFELDLPSAMSHLLGHGRTLLNRVPR